MARGLGLGLGLESRSELELGLEPNLSVAGGRVHSRSGHVAQRELVARVSLAAQEAKVRLPQRRSGSISGLQQVKCTGTAISFGKGYRLGHARRPQLYGDGARLLMHAAPQGGQGSIARVYIDGSDRAGA